MRALACAALGLLGVPGLAAQALTGGRIVRLLGQDTLPVTGVSVVLHRVGARVQGPVDTVSTDRDGRFHFRFAADSTAAFLLSARFAGIEYFSRQIAGDGAVADTGITLIVADTSSAQPVGVRHRTLLVSRPDASGTRVVIDWLVLRNRGPFTRVASDSAHAAWAAPIPPDAQNVELADNRLSQFGPEAVSFERDSIRVFAPLSPGDKELMLQYRIPGTMDRFVVPARVEDSVFVLLEEPEGRVVAPALAATRADTIEGRPFRRWQGTMGSGDAVTIELAGTALSSGQLLALLVAVLAAGFAAFGWRAVAKARRAA